MNTKNLASSIGYEESNSKLNALSTAEKNFLEQYFPSAPKKDSTESCEYCGNGCGVSDCASCCSQADNYFKFTKKTA